MTLLSGTLITSRNQNAYYGGNLNGIAIRDSIYYTHLNSYGMQACVIGQNHVF